MVFGLETTELQPHWTPLEAVAVVKCLNEDGEPVLSVRHTEGIPSWEAVGLLTAALDMARRDLAADFEEEQ